MDKIKDACPFCGRSNMSWRTVFESRSFVLIYDANPVADWHLLLVPFKHVLSFGYLEVDEIKEAHELITRVAKLMEKRSQHIIAFEHGNRFANKSEKPSVDHSHFHLISTVGRLDDHFPKSKRYTDFFSLNKIVLEASYYFYWDIVAGYAFYGPDSDIEPQFIRKVVSESIGLDDWNWRKGENGRSSQLAVKDKTQQMINFFLREGFYGI